MKTVTEIQDMLSDQLDRLSNDKMNAQQANAVCNTVGKIIGSIRLQFDYCRLTGRKPKPIGFLELATSTEDVDELPVVAPKRKK